ncbi:GNAT family N-acetyltransferase [Staphylococcus muscae]|uniref:GNAT family acetyltransferase n=1 Tax=Staphylococcus muscae TaxID=1294 RepID=A0A240C1J0_9STAP|nr:N-acetyltransferase [Staphylococcus muscae]AVQ32777.1 GNAT family N-acetyltransferase [Staphylococcus muscae]PNZ01786.1 GNAT family N-acetyltransferase [Staphylococcus muscae]GGA81242.1 putative N-acetyltransferase [Staphylococcus muscae]SNW01609.1 GNAT family acetyltransferase [Staphylococcus muscae]
MAKVTHLDINYKTEELFAAFRENFGNKDLYLVDELHGEMIDASSDSPFYGIFVGEKLVARMALYRKGEVEETYFPEYDDYLVIWKVEVLKPYWGKGYGADLLEFAKSFGHPIKAIARFESKSFFVKNGFEDLEAQNDDGHDILVWSPKNN